jgi:hypothetical protein
VRAEQTKYRNWKPISVTTVACCLVLRLQLASVIVCTLQYTIFAVLGLLNGTLLNYRYHSKLCK